MQRAHQSEFEQSRRDLRRPDQGAGQDCERLVRARSLQKTQQMRLQRAGHEGGRREIKHQDRHRAARRLSLIDGTAALRA